MMSIGSCVLVSRLGLDPGWCTRALRHVGTRAGAKKSKSKTLEDSRFLAWLKGKPADGQHASATPESNAQQQQQQQQQQQPHSSKQHQTSPSTSKATASTSNEDPRTTAHGNPIPPGIRKAVPIPESPPPATRPGSALGDASIACLPDLMVSFARLDHKHHRLFSLMGEFIKSSDLQGMSPAKVAAVAEAAASLEAVEQPLALSLLTVINGTAGSDFGARTTVLWAVTRVRIWGDGWPILQSALMLWAHAAASVELHNIAAEPAGTAAAAQTPTQNSTSQHGANEAGSDSAGDAPAADRSSSSTGASGSTRQPQPVRLGQSSSPQAEAEARLLWQSVCIVHKAVTVQYRLIIEETDLKLAMAGPDAPAAVRNVRSSFSAPPPDRAGVAGKAGLPNLIQQRGARSYARLRLGGGGGNIHLERRAQLLDDLMQILHMSEQRLQARRHLLAPKQRADVDAVYGVLGEALAAWRDDMGHRY